MHKLAVILAVSIGALIVSTFAGCAPLRDQNGRPVLDKNGNEQYHKAL